MTWYSLLRGGQAMVLDAAGRPLGETGTGLPFNPRAVFWRDDAWYVIGEGPNVFGWVRVSADEVLLDLQPHPLERPPGIFEKAVWAGESLRCVTFGRKSASYTLAVTPLHWKRGSTRLVEGTVRPPLTLFTGLVER